MDDEEGVHVHVLISHTFNSKFKKERTHFILNIDVVHPELYKSTFLFVDKVVIKVPKNNRHDTQIGRCEEWQSVIIKDKLPAQSGHLEIPITVYWK